MGVFLSPAFIRLGHECQAPRNRNLFHGDVYERLFPTFFFKGVVVALVKEKCIYNLHLVRDDNRGASTSIPLMVRSMYFYICEREREEGASGMTCVTSA